jgi:hypothetical protein
MSNATKNKWVALLTLLGLIQAPIVVLITQLMTYFGITTSITLSVTSILAAGFIVLGNYIKSTYDVQAQAAQNEALKKQLADAVVAKLDREKELAELKKQCEDLGQDPEITNVGDL